MHPKIHTPLNLHTLGFVICAPLNLHAPLDSCALGLALATGVACLHAHCGCSICPRFVLAKIGCLGLGAGLFRCNRAACHGWPVPGHRGQQAASLFRCRPAGRGPVPAAWRFKHCSGAAVAGTWQFLLPTLIYNVSSSLFDIPHEI